MKRHLTRSLYYLRSFFKSNWGVTGIGAWFLFEGFYIICNPDYMKAQERFGLLVGWIDDSWFGYTLLMIAVALVIAVTNKLISLKRWIVIFSAFLFGIYVVVFGLRIADGYPNSTWAFALLGLWYSWGITRFGDFDE